MAKYLRIYVFFSVIYLALLILGKGEYAWYCKPLLLPWLIFAVNEVTDFKSRKWLLFALLFSWTGDVVLLFDDRGELFFIIGLVSFLIAHFLYIILFLQQKREKTANKFFLILGILLVLAYLYGMLSLLFPVLGPLKIPVAVYASTISLMFVMAIRGGLTWSKPMNLLILNGAFAFVVSDSILALNKFLIKMPNPSFLIMSTYIIAQYLITLGILKLNENNSGNSNS